MADATEPMPDSLPHHSTAKMAPTAFRAPHPLWQFVRARLLEFFREPEAVFWVYGFPLAMTLTLGVAFRNPAPDSFSVAVIEAPGAQQLLAALQPPADDVAASTSPRGSFRCQLMTAVEAERRLRAGRVALVVVPVPQGSEDALPETSQAEPHAAESTATAATFPDVEYRFDPTRPESATARAAVDDALQRAAGRRDLLVVREQLVTEPGGRYIDFLVPGLIGASLMSGGLWGVGFVTIDLRVRNLLKRFVTTPMRKSHFLGGLMLSRFFFMVTEVALLLLFARWAFGVTVVGYSIWFWFYVVLGAGTFAGLGLLTACRVRTLEAASGLMNLVMMPMYVLSGIFFSYERFPEAAQIVIRVLPLTALIDALRGVMLEGATPWALLEETTVLVVWSVACFALSLRWFRWL